MSAFVVDASVWVSRLVPSEEFHAATRLFFDRERRAGAMFLSPALLLPEVAGAVARRTGGRALARRAVAGLLQLPELEIVALDESLVRAAARLAGDLGLRGADAVYVAVATRLRTELVTLDDDQRRRAASRVRVRVP